MSLANKEQEANSRILAAAQFLGEQHRLEVPLALAVVSGSAQERRVKRLLGMAEFLEGLALESIQPGLAEKLGAYGYTSLADLRKADLDDLTVVEGIGKKTAEAIQKALTEPAPDDELLTGPVPPFTEIMDDFLEEMDDDPPG